MIKSIGISLFMSCFVTLFCGCGTIKNGTTQDLMIKSHPAGAEVMVDGVEMGQTPVSVNLSRKSRPTITVRMYGYDNFQTSLERKLSGWAILGGPVGWLIDDATGGMYKLSPDQLNVQLVSAE